MSQSRSQTSSTRRLLPQRPPQPTTAEGPRAGLLLSFVLHAALIGATYFTWSRDAGRDAGKPFRAGRSGITGDGKDQCRGDGAAAAADTAQARDSPAHLGSAASAAIPAGRTRARAAHAADQDRAGAEKGGRSTQAPDKPKQNSQDFAALLNKLTATPKTPPNAKVGPRVVQGIGQANAMTADLAGRAEKPQILSMLEPAGGRAQRQRSRGRFRNVTLNQDGTVASAIVVERTTTIPQSSNNRCGWHRPARSAIYKCLPFTNLPALIAIASGARSARFGLIPAR